MDELLKNINAPENPKPGDYYKDNEGREWVCSADGTQWLEFKRNADGNIDTGLTNYDLNKMVIKQLPAKTTNGQLIEEKSLLRQFDNICMNKYYMLLCNDIHYYTVINHTDNSNESTFYNIVIELLQDNGDIKLIDWASKDHEAIECWIENSTDVYMFMLFPYDWGVVECE